MNEMSGARVGVVGLGRTGAAVVDALTTLGAEVHAYDGRAEAVEALAAPVASRMAGSPEEIAAALAASDLRLLVVSPGVPATGPILAAAQAAGIETWSEIELAWRLQRAAARPGAP